MRVAGSWAIAALLVAGCADDAAEERGAADDTAAVSDTAQATGSGESRFLTEMSDHHEGLVRIAERAQDRVTDDSVRSAAQKLAQGQAMERDSMLAMAQRLHQVRHSAQPMPKNAAQADSLAGMSGSEADRYFLRTTIGHHREGIGMIDRHIARLTTPEVRAMAEEMRAKQEREIRELEGKLSTL